METNLFMILIIKHGLQSKINRIETKQKNNNFFLYCKKK